MKKAFYLIALSLFTVTFTVSNNCYGNEMRKSSHSAHKFYKSQQAKDKIEIFPVSHASFALKYGLQTFVIDPVGGAEMYKDFGNTLTVLITDIHGDHLSMETLEDLSEVIELIICPKAVYEKLTDALKEKSKILNNGELLKQNSYSIEAIPMYNLREEALAFHEKGRGNGYVLSIRNKRIYISGDTEDIPEMRNLQNIDLAFVCMNLPYTMTVESAADAVLAFKPKQVYPYHYRGKGGFSDVDKFRNLVTESNPSIKVIQLDWYKNQ